MDGSETDRVCRLEKSVGEYGGQTGLLYNQMDHNFYSLRVSQSFTRMPQWLWATGYWLLDTGCCGRRRRTTTPNLSTGQSFRQPRGEPPEMSISPDSSPEAPGESNHMSSVKAGNCARSDPPERSSAPDPGTEAPRESKHRSRGTAGKCETPKASKPPDPGDNEP